MIFVQDSLGAQEADTVQHVISAAGAPQDTLGSRVDLQAVSETVTGRRVCRFLILQELTMGWL